MRILLDTHVWLWTLARPERIAVEARRRLADPDNELLLSAATVWEMAIKFDLGKLPLPEPPDVFVPPRLERDGVRALAVEMRHAAHVSRLPRHHRDPFDRLLVAQAQLEGLTLCTADAALDPYDVPRLRA